METKAEEVQVAETKRRGGQRGSRKKVRRRGREKTEKKKQRKEKMIEVKKVAEEWEIWDKEEEVAKSEEEAKKLVPEHFHK